MPIVPPLPAGGNITPITPGFHRVIEYLSIRGFPDDPVLRDTYGVRIQTAESIGRHGDNRLAAVFTHYDIHGHPIDWFSARLVSGVASFATLAKQPKTYCPPKELAHAYLPPTLDWTNIPEGSPIFIHESVLKSIAGARMSYYSIGLNGVWGWGSKKHEVALLSELKDLPWTQKKLHPIVVFDSNYDTNDDVRAAIAKLAERVQMICRVEVKHLPLPKPPPEFGKEDWGFDDYCHFHGADAGDQFLKGWRENVQDAGLSDLEMIKLDLNSQVAVVEDLAEMVVLETGALMSRQKFVDVRYAHYVATIEKKDGKLEQVNVPRIWLTDPRRRAVKRLAYTPGQDMITTDNEYNLWRPSDVSPIEGSVEPWRHLLEFSVPDENIRQWFIRWLAYPLQNPGCKMDTFTFIYGFPGTGKQAILAPLLDIYGRKNSITVGKEQLETDFNSIYARKQFVIFDEMNKGKKADPEALYNKLKKLTTLETIIINTKKVAEFEVDNHINFAVIANYPDALKLDDEDRRCCVIEFGSREKTLGKEWFTNYFAWLKKEGSAAVYEHLLNKVDLTGFNPHGDAPMTEMKHIATEASRRADEQWIEQLWEDPDQVIPSPSMDNLCLFTNDQLSLLCYSDMNEPPTAPLKRAFGIRMHAAGFRREALKIAKKAVWFYIVRKRNEEWTAERMRKHLKLFKYPGV